MPKHKITRRHLIKYLGLATVTAGVAHFARTAHAVNWGLGFWQKRNTGTSLSLTISTNTYNFNAAAAAQAAGWNGTSVLNLQLTVAAGVIIGSSSINQYAFDGGSLPIGSTITLTLNAGSYIVGAGGNGGPGTYDGTMGYPGENGGAAIRLTCNTTIANSGVIGAGGGGGIGGWYSSPGVSGGGGGYRYSVGNPVGTNAGSNGAVTKGGNGYAEMDYLASNGGSAGQDGQALGAGGGYHTGSGGGGVGGRGGMNDHIYAPGGYDYGGAAGAYAINKNGYTLTLSGNAPYGTVA